MGQSLKATLQAVLSFALVAGVIGWLIQKVPAEVAWSLRLGGPVVALPIAWLLWRNAQQKDLVPDMLSPITPRYFERDGLCFALVPMVEQGVCWMQVFFQNRYERTCLSRILIQPPRRSFSLGRIAQTGIDVEVACEGAGFGVCRVPWPIAEKLQGKAVAFEVAASTTYPGGAGKLLRFREGLRVGSAGGAAARTAATAGLLLVGVIHVSKPAIAHLRLPTGVATELPPHLHSVLEFLWRPETAAGGFPVTPPPAAAR